MSTERVIFVKSLPNFQTSHSYATINDRIVNGGYQFRVSTTGTSAATPPAWNTGIGQTTTSGTVVFTCEENFVYNSVQSAINAAGTSPGDPTPSFSDRYTVLIYPGKYAELITCRSYVNITGVNKSSVFIEPATPSSNGTVQLASFVEVSSLTVNMPSSSTSSHFAIKGTDVTDIGLRNIDIIPLGLPPPGAGARSQCILITGNSWHTILMDRVGMSYFGDVGYAIQILGNPTAPQNADMHMESVFVDALYITTSTGPGGAVYIKDCNTLYIRNSLVRTTHQYGSAVRVDRTTSPGSNDVSVLLEATNLENPFGTQTVHLMPYTKCFFKHSQVDGQPRVDAGAQLLRYYPDRVLIQASKDTFSLLGSGGTLTQSLAGVCLRRTTHTGTSLAVAKRPAPTNTPWTITALLTPVRFHKQWHSSGLILRNSSTGKLTYFKYMNNALHVSKFNNITSFAADYSTGAIASFPGQYGLWMRIYYDGTSLQYQASSDGQEWVTYFFNNPLDWLTPATPPDEVGFCADAEETATPNLDDTTTLLHWEQTT